MKIHVPLLVAAVGAIFSFAPVLHAAPPTKAEKRAKVAEMMKDPETSRMAFEEMMKSTEKKRYMAKVLARDKEFRDFYAGEVGNNAPHEERNPSSHPENFQKKQ